MRRRQNGEPIPTADVKAPPHTRNWKKPSMAGDKPGFEVRAASPRYEPGVYVRNGRATQLGEVYMIRTHWFEMQAYVMAKRLTGNDMIFPEYVRDLMRKLAFTADEWDVFERGVMNGDFLQV